MLNHDYKLLQIQFGGIDILINNASAISLISSTVDTDMKRYDLMHNINTRGTFLM